MKRIISLFFLFLLSFAAIAQVTTEPTVITETGVVKVIFDAAKGNCGLKGYTGSVYAHTGVITDKSTSGSDWKYAPTWGDNQEKYKLTSLGNDLWQLTISPDIRTYYGVSADDKILKLAFVFRSEDTKKEGKGEGNTDIFVTLNEEAFVPSTPENKPRPANIIDGINYLNDNEVTLSIYAPGKEHIHLLGDFNNWKKDNDWQLYKDGDYWWITVSGLEKGKEYAFQYLVDNQFKIADAYSEKILDPSNDSYISSSVYPDLKSYPMQTEGIVSVMQTAKSDYNWQVTNFEPKPGEQLAIYELLIRDFTEEGTIAAATEKLDYLKAMGVNAVELMPIQEFDGNDSWGYNPCFYFASDKAYGTPDDYKYFIDEAHKLDMAVIVDVVFNHATALNPFARLYWDGVANKPASNNPWFNVDAPHPYSVFCDFNHEYSGTRDFFKRVLKYWLTTYNIDGFRFDLTKGFTQKQSTEATASNYDASRIAILKDYHSYIQSINSKAYTILEHFCENKEEKELADDGMFLWDNMNNAYCQSIMGYKENSGLTAGSATSRGWTKQNLVAFQESHDEERTMYKAKTWGVSSIKDNETNRFNQAALNAAFLLCTPGPKMIWQFGELGYDYSIEENGRTGRKPVRWDYLDSTLRSNLYDTYAQLLKVRKEYPALFANPESVTMQTASSDWTNGRRIMLKNNNLYLLLLGNFTNNAISMESNFPVTGTWTNIFDKTTENQDKTIPLAAHSFCLYIHDGNGSANNVVDKSQECKITLKSNNVFVECNKSISRISVYSFGGKLMKYVDNAKTMDVSGMSGLYLITARSADGKVYSLKVSL